MNLRTEVQHEINNTRIEEDSAWNFRLHGLVHMSVRRSAKRRSIS